MLAPASRKLVEYEIQKEVLKISSVGNISRAYMKFVFRRRIEYHITNTVMQTFILVIVGYLSLFFDVENFTDRIMVVLTTMYVIQLYFNHFLSNDVTLYSRLVIATIMSSIQQVCTMVWSKVSCLFTFSPFRVFLRHPITS